MASIDFWKMSGSGNDFILIDNRACVLAPDGLKRFIVNVCRRRMAVGADGLILIDISDRYDFKWHFFNSDGSRAEMCGNGARCAARYAYLNGVAGSRMAFETDVGVIRAEMIGKRVKIRMTDPGRLERGMSIDAGSATFSATYVNTGVPHVVIPVQQLDDMDVQALGRKIRYHPLFAPEGTNVNFVQSTAAGLKLRTYERGVEAETLACGTGAVAAALAAAATEGRESPVEVVPAGGGLKIFFTCRNGRFSDVYLEGDARVIYKAEMNPETWDYKFGPVDRTGADPRKVAETDT